MEHLLKNWLKKLKLNEPAISTILGGFVIIVVGILIFNYFKIGRTGEILEEETGSDQAILSESEKQNAQEEIPEKHVVESGECLWKISEKYYKSGYNWVNIAKENNIQNPDIIIAGQELKLPKIEIKIAQEQKSETNNNSKKNLDSANPITEDKYQVKKGDSLWKIALRAYGDCYKWPEIAKANNLPNPDYIEIDQELKIPR